MDNFKIIIIGDIDHGKSTLIGRLLYDTGSLSQEKIEEAKRASKDKEIEFAYLLDHLKEEREQGITIDTSQTFFKSLKREYVIIDAPGHVQFVRNMITGASQAEAAVLIIDAEKGIKEQTRRHVNILSLLGIKQLIVVFNKMDLAGYQKEIFQELKQETESFLNSINIKASHYIPISAFLGYNIVRKSAKMDWYQGLSLLQSFDSLEKEVSSKEKPLLLPVQDVYQEIIVGRVESGSIKQGQEIKILPKGIVNSVKSINKFNEQLIEASEGENIGITLQDRLDVKRGDVICQINKEPVLTDNFKANIFWLAEENLKKGETVSLKCASQEVPVKIKEIRKKIDSANLRILEENALELENLEVGEMILETERPIAITKFNEIQELGRFILIKNGNISAGGIIT
jgi:sulfate adenylyltransferase large subunit